MPVKRPILTAVAAILALHGVACAPSPPLSPSAAPPPPTPPTAADATPAEPVPPEPDPTHAPTVPPRTDPATSPGAAPDPAADPDQAASRWAELTLESLTLEEKAGQLMMPFIFGDFSPEGSSAGNRAQRFVEEHGVGGLIVSVGSPTEVAAKLNWLQSIARVPLLIGADLEAGAGFRFDGVVHMPTRVWLGGATRFPALMALGATDDETLAYEMGRVTAVEARAVGVHVPFAPVLDVNNNPENPVINVRSFGEDPGRVASLGASFVRGIQDHGAIATAKHFPGHGDTGVDSHLALPVIRVSRERMDSVELRPFRRALGAGLGAIMTAHITVPEITGARTPATLASSVLTDLLRGEMGFDGLVVTDAMDMAAVDRMFGRGEAAVRAIEAGADVILMPPDLAAARAGIVAAVRSGRLSEARLDESVVRILQSKAALGLHDDPLVDVARVRERVGTADHWGIAQRVAERSITLLKDERELVPLRGTPSASVYSVTYRRPNDIRAGQAFNARLRQTYRRLRTTFVEPSTTSAEYNAIVGRARQMDLIVVSLHVGVRTSSGSVAIPEATSDFVRALSRLGPPVVVIAFGNPYLLMELPEVGTWLNAWSGVPVSERAAVDAILGKTGVTGRAPTRIADFPIGHGLQVPVRGR